MPGKFAFRPAIRICVWVGYDRPCIHLGQIEGVEIQCFVYGPYLSVAHDDEIELACLYDKMDSFKNRVDRICRFNGALYGEPLPVACLAGEYLEIGIVEIL